MCRGIIRPDGPQQYRHSPPLLLRHDLTHIHQPAGLAIVAAFDKVAAPVRSTIPIPTPVLKTDYDEIKDLHPGLTTHQTNASTCTLRSSKKEAQKSIFSTGALSPPGYNFLGRPLPSPDFLGACFFCRRSLEPGKDIYMYSGDEAFCSTECRYKQIVADESPSCTFSPVERKQPPQSSSFINRLAFTSTTAVTMTVAG